MTKTTAMLVLGATLAMGMTSPVWAQDGNQADQTGSARTSATVHHKATTHHARRHHVRSEEDYRARAQAPGVFGQGEYRSTAQSNYPFLYQDQDPDVRNPM
jgi:hypothetical protein